MEKKDGQQQVIAPRMESGCGNRRSIRQAGTTNAAAHTVTKAIQIVSVTETAPGVFVLIWGKTLQA